MLNERVVVFHQAAVQMLHIENTLIAEIQLSRRKLMQQIQLGNLKEEEYILIFNKIYGKKADRTLSISQKIPNYELSVCIQPPTQQ
jgi:hypothetical protein